MLPNRFRLTVPAALLLIAAGVNLTPFGFEFGLAHAQQPDAIAGSVLLSPDPVKLFSQRPVSISGPAPNVILIDFGRVAFGNLQFVPPAGSPQTITVHFGENLKDGRVDRQPPGTVRYSRTTVQLKAGNRELSQIVTPPIDARNTENKSSSHPPAILTPKDWGVVTPFRWVEIEGWDGELKPDQIVRRAAFASNWDDAAASFNSSDETLNQIWELCRYSIKATTFAGVYVDGDRERIPYEADAYLNQLSHYYTDNDRTMARRTFDHLMQHGTWPSEWAPHMVFMAHADWMQTGDAQWLKPRFDALKAKTLAQRAGPDGLIRSNHQQRTRTDIVDWPTDERDGYVFTNINTVVNAFHLAAIKQMAELARAIGNEVDARDFESRFEKTLAAFNDQLFNTTTGLYQDGIGTDHASLHANLFPLAFDLVPADKRTKIIDWLRERDMDCSVYAAQYLLEALFSNGADDKAIALIAAPTDRSWRHMVESGATITWEAWDMKYKPNQDWNHAWGAAPANLLPRFVLGVQPLDAGWQRAIIRPCVGSLEFAGGKIPTSHGPILIDWKNDATFEITVKLPAGMSAKVELPASEKSRGVQVNGQPVDAKRIDSRWFLTDDIRGEATIQVD